MESFYNALKHAHSGWRWVVLILLIYAIYNAFSKKGKEYTPADRKLNMFAMVATHIQLLMGLIMYFMNPGIRMMWSHMGEVMGVSVLRHNVIEHPFGMILSIVLITIGHSKSKKALGAEKHRKIALFYTIALVVILASIPWPFRGWGNGWF